MPNWPTKLIDAYRLATSPYRSWCLASRRRSGTVPVYVLFYHRVADCFGNGWTMGCDDFRRQIDWLEQNFEIVDLLEAQRRIRGGSNRRPTVAITFDDGYAENCEFALPLLIERRIPVTYFVTLEHAKNQTPFQHDVDNGQALPVNTIESLRALSISGIEIGAHSRSHLDLGQISDPHQIVDEVITSARELEALVEQKIRYFAFPFGKLENLNGTAFQLLKREGFLGGCTTIQTWNEIGGDDFQIARIHGDPNFARFRNWLTYDPRLAKAELFDYQSASLDEPPIQVPAGRAVFPSTVVTTPTSENVSNPAGF